jgi:hypothetical protein
MAKKKKTRSNPKYGRHPPLVGVPIDIATLENCRAVSSKADCAFTLPSRNTPSRKKGTLFLKMLALK